MNSPVAAPKEDFLKPRFEELAKQTKQVVAEKRRLAAEKEALAKQSQEFNAWKATQADKLRNPLKYVEADYGPEWYDKLTQVKLTGVSTPDLLASELEEREKRLNSTFDEREAKLRKELDDFKASQDNAAREEYVQAAVAHVKADKDKYFWLNEFAEYGQVPAEIERHFIATAIQNPDGSIEPGEILSAEEAGGVIEKRITELVERAKAAEARREAAKAPKPAPTSREAPHRRTLTNDLTATSAPASPAMNDAERKKRAFAAWDAVQANRQH